MASDERFATHRILDLHVSCRDVPLAVVVQAIELHRRNVALGRDACLKWGPGSCVSHVLIRSAARPHDLAVKSNPWRGWRGALSDTWNGSRAARALDGARRVAAAGLASPEVVAVAERRGGGVVRESFLLTRFAAGAEPLPVVLTRLREAPEARRALSRRVGETIGALHAAGLDHRDLKHSNLLVDAEGRVALLDLEALGRLAPFAWRRRVRALGELEAFARDLSPWLSSADRAEFLAGYLGRQPALAPRGAELLRAVDGEAARRTARWARRTRPAQRHFPLAPRDTLPCTTAEAAEDPAGLPAGGPGCDSR
jgi:heptose I phosphotransferase